VHRLKNENGAEILKEHRTSQNPDWDTVGYVSSSEPRLKLLVHLSKQASSPSSMSREYKIPISRVSVVLKELQGKDLVECLTGSVRKGKLFKATGKGVAVIKDIHFLTDLERSMIDPDQDRPLLGQ
jgi:predicted transcriptional regulator